LRALWTICQQQIADAQPKPEGDTAGVAKFDPSKIDAMFPDPAQPLDPQHGWVQFNRTELQVAAYLTQAQLRQEYPALLNLARTRGLTGLMSDDDARTLFADDAKLNEQRSAYLTLLYALQSAFIESRFVRRLRGEVARRLFAYGIWAVLLALAVPALYLIFAYFQLGVVAPGTPPGKAPRILFDESFSTFGMVATFGMLGAYFSRMMAFQSNLATIKFDEVVSTYVGRMLRLRMLYGLIGALIFYLLVRSRAVQGPLFPTVETTTIADHVVGWVGGKAKVATTLTILLPSAELAKLLVWSFIAGFSERLVPETLARVENTSQNSDKK
jgi:hypothetical protein